MSARERETPALLVLGMMSGTSADGIDVALARIGGAPPRLRAQLLAHAALKFPPAIRNEILRVAEQQSISAGQLSQLNFRLGEIFAEAALAACRKFRVSPGRVALIGSHGQTIFHQGRPTKYFGRATASTLQIGEPSIIAARTGITTVGDFRPADMAAGGQGAPLVPYADYLLYRHPAMGRVSLNLGGIANITVIPAAAKPSEVFAFDTGPANMVIDALVAHFTKGRQRFDEDAVRATQGRRIAPIVDELLHDAYLKVPPPKSTGREYYGREYTKRLIAMGHRYHAKPNDLIRAATIFTALSIVDALNRFVLPQHKIRQLIVSGGGAKNPLILGQIAAALPGMEVLPSSRLGVPEDAKEAFAFALLAYETLHHRPSNIPGATGARHPAILGKICYAPQR
jgi:anhydro-N-acetylmuramic acid kinase